jgi:hypothetical protein
MRMRLVGVGTAVGLTTLLGCTSAGEDPLEGVRAQWTEQEATDWFAAQPRPIGVNYAPRTAVNQLEMWQAETWDPETIDQELQWAEEIGFNTARVFLHDQVWQQGNEAYLDRIDAFLDIADSHGIRVMLVFFDGVWHPNPVSGPQPDPIPGVHNSQWVQSPGAAVLSDASLMADLEPYVTGVVEAFRDDPRVLVWDLFNEPDNTNLLSYRDEELEASVKSERALDLLVLATEWARAADPVQPLTAGVFEGEWADPEALSPLNAFLLQELDVVSFHTYSDAVTVAGQVSALAAYGRPLLCTEYMARPMGSTFQDILPVFDAEDIGAYNWGFVDGRIQTIYSWASWIVPEDDPPEVWFHDVLHADGTAFDAAEVEAIGAFGSL